MSALTEQAATVPAPFDRLSFADRVAVVSGGAQGIGRATASLLAGLGATVVVSDIDADKAQSTADEITASGGVAWGSGVDICSRDDATRLAGELQERHGGVDVLVNVAAIAAVADIAGHFLDMEREKWMRLIDVNLVGTITMTQAVLPLMLGRRDPAVVNFVSDSYKGLDVNLAVYSASKAGVAAFTKALAREVGPKGVRVNGVSPSATRTRSTEEMVEGAGDKMDKILRMYPLRRLGEPDDQAWAVAFLASSASTWITGQVVSVNGGYN